MAVMPHRRSTHALVLCGVLFLLSVAVAAQRGQVPPTPTPAPPPPQAPGNGPGPGPGAGPGPGNGGNNPIATLKGVAIPQPDLSPYVARRDALIALGKALFWDVQVGSDGQTACATCHFHAGADHRITNQVAGPITSMASVRANTTLTLNDFPFHTFANPNDNTSAATRARRDVVGSAGVVLQRFVGITDGAMEVGANGSSTGLFTIGGASVRQVTSRNAPSVINAVLNHRNFWDGRASNVFNASTPFGAADARAMVLVATANGLQPQIGRAHV